MVDKKSDVFNKPTAASTAEAAKKEADRSDAFAAKAEAAAERNASFTKPKPLDIKDDRDADTSFTTDHHTYFRTYPSGNVPSGVWGMAVWTRDRQPEEYPAFLDNQGDWWWATTTNQNGVNPAVEKTEEPIGWRGF